jgi:hypothetical protein
MKTKTHFTFRVDIWDDTGDSIVEHVAGVDDFEVAEATYRAAVGRWPRARITLRQGIRVVQMGPMASAYYLLLRRLTLLRSIRKSSTFFPLLIAATSHFGLAPLPAQVSPVGLRYFGWTFLPFNRLPR